VGGGGRYDNVNNGGDEKWRNEIMKNDQQYENQNMLSICCNNQISIM